MVSRQVPLRSLARWNITGEQSFVWVERGGWGECGIIQELSSVKEKRLQVGNALQCRAARTVESKLKSVPKMLT